MNPAPGSMLWLLRHELKLTWRTAPQKFSAGVMLAFVLLSMQGFAFMVAFWMTDLPHPSEALERVAIAATALFVFLIMLSTGLAAVVQAIYSRGDADLLLSSPVPARSIMLARTLAIAANVSLGCGFFMLPFANAFGIVVSPRWFVAYVAMPSIAILATTLALLIALGLFHAVGARRTRLVSQIFAGVVGMLALIVTQYPNMMQGEGENLMKKAEAMVAAVALPDAGSWVWFPARAFSGEPLPLAIAVLIALGGFLAVAFGLSDRFIVAMAASNEVGSSSSSRPAKKQKSGALRFSTGIVAVLRRKDLRLVARDPWLITQLMQQAVVMVPAFFVMWKNHTDDMPALWLTVVVLAGTFAAGLAWLAVSGEDSPDLLTTAPLRPFDVTRAKFEASVLPVALVLAVPIGLATWTDPWLGFTLLVCGTAAAVTGAFLHILYPVVGKRSEFNKRAQGRLVIAFAEFGFAAGWAGVAAGMLLHSWLALIGPPLLIIVLVTRRILWWMDGERIVAAA